MYIKMRKDDAIKSIGTPKTVAEKIGVTKQAVSQWGEHVPEVSALKLLRIDPNIPHEILETKKPHQAN